ncbi:hypothetical protein B0H12DRAFT_1092998 [Mycena haematopus]|nr:hypothetical protein B0H12DRAFT_1092998 [Mycena haematopus]
MECCVRKSSLSFLFSLSFIVPSLAPRLLTLPLPLSTFHLQVLPPPSASAPST